MMMKRGLPSETGAVLPLIAVSMTLIFISMALALDLGWIVLGKNQLQNTADASALAGVVELMEVGLEPTENEDTWDVARNVAADYALLNRVAGKNPILLDMDSNDVQTGWIEDFRDLDSPFDTSANFHNSLQVTARLIEDLNGPVQLFLGAFTGQNEVALTARGTATAENRIGALKSGRIMPIVVMERWKREFVKELFPESQYPELWVDVETDEDGNPIDDDEWPHPKGQGWWDQYVDDDTPIALKQFHNEVNLDANFDWVFFNNSSIEGNNQTQNNDLWNWFVNGVSPEEIEAIFGADGLTIPSYINADNASGFRSSLWNNLFGTGQQTGYRGDHVILLMFDEVTRISESRLRFQISKWIGVELVDRSGSGNSQVMLVRPKPMNASEIGDFVPDAPMGNLYILSLTR